MSITSPLVSHRAGPRLEWRIVALFCCSTFIAAMAVVGIIHIVKTVLQ